MVYTQATRAECSSFKHIDSEVKKVNMQNTAISHYISVSFVPFVCAQAHFNPTTQTVESMNIM